MWVFPEQMGRGQAHSEMQRLQHCARGLNCLNRNSLQVGLADFQKLVTCVCNQVVHSKDLLRGKWSCDIYFVYFVTKSKFQTNNTQILRVSLNLNQFVSSCKLVRGWWDDHHPQTLIMTIRPCLVTKMMISTCLSSPMDGESTCWAPRWLIAVSKCIHHSIRYHGTLVRLWLSKCCLIQYYFCLYMIHVLGWLFQIQSWIMFCHWTLGHSLLASPRTSHSPTPHIAA